MIEQPSLEVATRAHQKLKFLRQTNEKKNQRSMIKQTRNQEFFRSGEVFRNQGGSIKNLLKTQEKNVLQGKFWSFFS